MSWWTNFLSWFRTAKAEGVSPAEPRGALDVLSPDLGQPTGWAQRGKHRARFYSIYEAIVTDAIFLRATFLYERLARQGGITLEAAQGEDIQEARADRALQEVKCFLDSVITPHEERWEDLFFSSVGELARFANFSLERVYQGNRFVNLDLLPWISMVMVRDLKGKPAAWDQFDYYLRRQRFELHEIGHGYIDRIPGDPYGSPALEPASGDSGDLKAYRALEALQGQQAQHLTYPDRIINYGTEDFPETSQTKLDAFATQVEDMAREGVLIGNGRVSAISLKPEGINFAPILKYWQERAVLATGFSRVRLGIGDDTNVATADVIAATESQNVLAMVLSACASWRRAVFIPILCGIGLPATLAPRIVPGEPDPVRRQKKGEHAATLYEKGVITQDEARLANGYQPLTDEQIAYERGRKQDDTPSTPNEPEDRRENRGEE